MRLILIIFILYIPLAKTFGQDIVFNAVVVGQQAPDFMIQLDSGRSIQLSDLKGKIVYINFFATWCSPCIAEIPRIKNEIWTKYKNNKDFVILLIGKAKSEEQWAAFVNKNSKFNLLPVCKSADNTKYSLYTQHVIPWNYIINKNGKVIYARCGYTQKEFNELSLYLAKLLM